MSSPVLLWWFSLCAVSGLNVLVWVLSAAALRRRQSTLAADAYASRRLQLMLSAGFVCGCAFRSVFPVFDVPRLCVVDTWLSSVIVGRTVATLAELCFAAQWALLMRETARAAGSGMGRVASWAVLPVIVMAEACSWYSVLTTANIGHVIEASLWTLCAVLLITSFVSLWPRCAAALRPLLGVLCVAGLAYVLFMLLIDVPMYWSRWLADEANGRRYLGLTQGLIDASVRRVVSHRWEDWQDEIAWMSLYFSAAVWFSIALVHTPVFESTGKHGESSPS